MDCLFCKIIAGQMPAKVIYQDEKMIAFDDIAPQAPHHKILIPKKHIETLNHLEQEDAIIIGHIIHSAAKIADQLNISHTGYRLVANCNTDGGQTVYHIHFHLLGGRRMAWPPG